jgi:hypothetical protein
MKFFYLKLLTGEFILVGIYMIALGLGQYTYWAYLTWSAHETLCINSKGP